MSLSCLRYPFLIGAVHGAVKRKNKQKWLALHFAIAYGLAMQNEITPEQVEAAALAARMPLYKFLAKAGVSRGTFYKWQKGNPVRPLTLAKLADAMESNHD